MERDLVAKPKTLGQLKDLIDDAEKLGATEQSIVEIRYNDLTIKVDKERKAPVAKKAAARRDPTLST